MTTRLGLAAGALGFLIVATANSGGYRYGVSDQAFYIPAISLAADPELFPRDAAILQPQMRWWLADDMIAAAGRALGLELPDLFAVLYVAGVLALFLAVVALMRALGASWWAVAGAVALFSLRHRIAKTGVNTLEGYMHPRMIAFAIGLAAVSLAVQRKPVLALGLVVAAGAVHPTTALWFGTVMGLAALASAWPRRLQLVFGVAGAAVAGLLVIRGRVMDADWLAVLSEKDYLFPTEWPAYAWVLNLAYVPVLYLLYRRRVLQGRAGNMEAWLGTGWIGLLVIFLVSVPFTVLRFSGVVQLQVNRVFWLFDAAVLCYLAWWLCDDWAARRSPRVRQVVVALLVAAAATRGAYILQGTGRPLWRTGLPADEWTEMLTWLKQQSPGEGVLVDPGHAWRYGASVRAGALHDVVLEQSKDAAMAMYDRDIALRVAERGRALSAFDQLGEDHLRTLGRRFGASILIVERPRTLDLPVRHSNERFVAYAIR